MALPPAAKGQAGAPERMVSASSATRLVLLLLALWTAYSGLALTFFQGNASIALGGGIGDDATRRLLGIHILALAPVYALLGWNPRKYGILLWLPYVTQFGIVAVTLFDLTKHLKFEDAGASLVVSLIFLVLLFYLWYAGRRPLAERRLPTGAPTQPSRGPSPGETGS